MSLADHVSALTGLSIDELNDLGGFPKKKVQCSHTIRGPKKGRIYIHSPRQCKNTVFVDADAYNGYCHIHDRRRALIAGTAK